jgi:hypothetical protein
MVTGAGWLLAKGMCHLSFIALMLIKTAATVSVRYATVRRQGEKGPDGLERQTISYSSVYGRLLPIISHAYVFIHLGKTMVQPFHAGGRCRLIFYFYRFNLSRPCRAVYRRVTLHYLLKCMRLPVVSKFSFPLPVFRVLKSPGALWVAMDTVLSLASVGFMLTTFLAQRTLCYFLVHSVFPHASRQLRRR